MYFLNSILKKCQAYYIHIICLGVKKNLYEIKGIPMKEDEGSSPIVHNYRVNKKKHPRSSGK